MRAVAMVLTGLCTLLACASAQAHPHMFFDAKAQFLMDAEGRLEAVRIAIIVDEFNSLYTLSELQLDADGDGALTPDEERELALSMSRGLSDYNFYTELSEGGAAVILGSPRSGAAIVDQGQIAATFDLPLTEPVDPTGRALTLRLYDPSYFTEITVLAAPDIIGGEGRPCRVAYKKFELDSGLAQLQTQLSALAREETPDDGNIGAKFADTATLTCDT